MLRKYLPRSVKNLVKQGLDFLIWDPWVNRSWSQEGEDMVLRRIFEGKTNGFYIDVGAHHPKRFSNTYLFYRKGWKGINIDAMPGSMKLFHEWRPRDMNLEMGVAQTAGILDYYVFNETALNGFSERLSQERNQTSSTYHVKQVIQVNVLPLRDILNKYLGDREIDFMSVDVEGFDLEVLKSNDWSRYRPKFVLAEILKSSLHNLSYDSIVLFMKEQGYDIYAKQVNTVFFKDIRSPSV